MAINLTTKYSAKVAERLKKGSITAAAASNDYDWDGAKTIKVYSVDTVPLGDYSRSGSSRYGTPADLTDSLQTMEITQDKAFTYIIDKGDDAQQLNIKKANRALQREIDERVIPMLDKYRIAEWVKGAGNVVTYASGSHPTKTTVIDAIMDASEKLDNSFAPESGRTLFVSNGVYKLIKESSNFVYTDKLAQDALVKGQVGELDGMKVVKVPSSYLPAGVDFFIAHKSAILAPVQLKDYKIHTDPPGVNGSLTEGRILHGAFVLDSKAGAVCVYGNNATLAIAAPTITDDSANNVCKFANAGGYKMYYTIDGTDPRCSGTRIEVTGNNSANSASWGDVTVKAISYNPNGTVQYSGVVEAEYTK